MTKEAARSTAGPRRELSRLAAQAAECRRCDLWKHGTQTVFGSGDARAAVMLVGEQPGDKEDLAGEPFVGPAGQLLREILVEVGMDLRSVYLTNAVKHFKWKARGKRRMHDKPSRAEILACQPWLDEEIALVRPGVIVALGATAASVLFGTTVRVTRDRGTWLQSPRAPFTAVTVHPSSILRTIDARERADARRRFADDLRRVAEHVVAPQR